MENRLLVTNKTSKKDGVLIKILVVTIILLVLTLGYDMYISIKTKGEIGSINADMDALNKQKLKLTSQRNALQQNVNQLEEEIQELKQKRVHLIAQKLEGYQ